MSNFEIGAVWGQPKRVTPVLHGVKPDAVGPIQEIKAVDLNDVEQFLEQLKQRVSASQKIKR